MTNVVMGLVLGGIIYYNEKSKEGQAKRVTPISLRLGEELPKVREVGVSIGIEFEKYSIAEVKDTLVDNVRVEEGSPQVRIRYYYENGSFLELKALDRFVNQGLSGINRFQLFQDSIFYNYHP